jgi:hypothetical protein
MTRGAAFRVWAVVSGVVVVGGCSFDSGGEPVSARCDEAVRVMYREPLPTEPPDAGEQRLVASLNACTTVDEYLEAEKKYDSGAALIDEEDVVIDCEHPLYGEGVRQSKVCTDAAERGLLSQGAPRSERREPSKRPAQRRPVWTPGGSDGYQPGRDRADHGDPAHGARPRPHPLAAVAQRA